MGGGSGTFSVRPRAARRPLVAVSPAVSTVLSGSFAPALHPLGAAGFAPALHPLGAAGFAPARGFPPSQVIPATIVAVLITAGIVYGAVRYRRGRLPVLDRIASAAS